MIEYGDVLTEAVKNFIPFPHLHSLPFLVSKLENVLSKYNCWVHTCCSCWRTPYTKEGQYESYNLVSEQLITIPYPNR